MSRGERKPECRELAAKHGLERPGSRASRSWLAGLAFVAALVLALLATAAKVDAAVMAIDYGAQWFKVSLVKPGVPLEIVLNRESKRKTRSIVALRDGKRTFDTEAVNLAGRFPKVSYDGLKNLIGKLYDDPIVEAYRETFDNNMIKEPTRGTVAFQHPDGTIYSVEDLVAMQFKHAKELTETMAGDSVRDCVISIPRFFNQYERQALLDAAELAGLRILALIHDDFAVALNFAMTRNFNDTAPEYHIFYDMGAGSTAASLVAFQNVPADPRLPKKTVPQLEVKSVGYDKTLGGHAFDIRLQKLLAETFDKEKSGSSGKVFKNQRAMMKLLNQATRVKEILSANTEIGVSIESLMDDIDFRTKVSRQEFDDMSKDLFDRVTAPVKTVVEKAGLKMDQISSIILVGGSTRIPAVQAALRELVGEERIAKNVNSDEAAVLGAGFRGAGISKQFKVREIRVKDINMFPVEVAYAAEQKEGKDERTIKTLLFAEGAVLPSRKLMTFRRVSDFDFSISYRNDEGKEAIVPAKFIESTVPGVVEALGSFKANESIKLIGEPKIKATIALSESGLVNVVDVAAYFDLEVQRSLKDRVLSFFGGKSENGTATNSTDETPAPDGTGPGPISEAAANETAADKEKDKKPELKQERIPLNLTVLAAGILPMDSTAKTKSLARLLAMDAEDRARQQLAEARNQLESFTYSLRDFLSDEETEKCSTTAEREVLSTKLSEASDWLYSEGETAELPAVRGKLSELQTLRAPIELRKKEKKQRPESIAAFKQALDAAKLWVETTKTKNKEGAEKSEKAIAEWEAKEAAKASGEVPVPAEEAKTEEAAAAAAPAAADTPAEAATNETAAPAANTTSSNATTAATAPEPPKPFIAIHTTEELDALLALTSTHSSWLLSKQSEQDKLGDDKEPVLLTSELDAKAEEVKREMVKLMRRRKPVVKTSAGTTTSSSKKTTSTTTSTSAAETIKVETEEKKEEPKKDEL